MDTDFAPSLRDFLSGCVYLLPMVMGFVGMMLLIGSMSFDFLGAVLLLGSVPLHLVCKWAADELWDDGDVV